MQVKNAYVSRDNLAEVFSIIEDALITEPNTQVHVENALFEELKMNGNDVGVELELMPRSGHYYSDGLSGEIIFSVNENHWYGVKTAVISFINNSSTHMQVVLFKSTKMKNEYFHVKAGFESLLLIGLK